MPITVVCGQCKTRLQVSEKFAGKSGACPKCKAVVKIPLPQDEVKVHAPEEFGGGGKNAAGQLVIKPIARQDAVFKPWIAVTIAVAVILVLIGTRLAGGMLKESALTRVVGLLLITPPLVLAPYRALRDDELEPHTGTALYVRTAICTLAYVLLWGVIWFLMARGITEEPLNWAFIAPPVLIIGSLAALGCFDLDPTSGAMHYGFYLVVCLGLRWLAGMPWLWDVPRT